MVMLDDEGTPPAGCRFLSDEAESPSYHGSQARTFIQASGLRGLGKEPSHPSHSYLHVPSSAFAQAGRSDDTDVLQLMEEKWYWQARPVEPEIYPDAWQTSKAHKGLESQRGVKYAALRATTAQGSNSTAVGSVSIRAQPQVREVPAASQRSEGLSEVAESDISESSRWNGRADSPPEVNPEDVDSLGTWAQRVLFFPSQPDKHTKAKQAEREAENEAASAVDHAQNISRRQSQLRRQESKEEEEAAHAAWRWRFNRRWRNEQAKQFDPDFGMDGDDEDGWEDALRHLDACGPGVHLQIGRTSSDRREGSLKSTSSGGLGVLFDDSLRDKTLASEADNATTTVASKAKKVEELYKNQRKIERDVKARWGNASVSMTWAGSHVRAVDIDNYGHFSFILAKLVDNTKAHRLAVRGRHNSTTKELLKALTAEVEDICSKRRLPMVRILLLGTGTMDWSREKDYRINVSQGVMAKGCDAIQTNDDVVRVAGALTRSSLSGPTRVTVNGEKLS